MKNSVKIKHVIGHPDEVISTLTDLILKGEVNVVLFDHYELFSPDELEEKLSRSINLNTGWETDYFSWGTNGKTGVEWIDKSGLKFNKVGESKITDKEVIRFIWNKNNDSTLYFLDGLNTKICDGVYECVMNTVYDYMEKGMTKEDVLWEERIWDHVDWVIEDYLDEDVQEIFKLYEEKDDWTLMDFTYGEVYDLIKQEYEYNGL